MWSKQQFCSVIMGATNTVYVDEEGRAPDSVASRNISITVGIFFSVLE
jgi:hypothetical protein